MTAPAIGSRWRHRLSGNVYEYIGPAVDSDHDDGTGDTYCHAVRLVELAPKPEEYLPLGLRMAVELPWFERAAKEIT